MLPTSSSADLVGAKVRSATALSNGCVLPERALHRRTAQRRTAYVTGLPSTTTNCPTAVGYVGRGLQREENDRRGAGRGGAGDHGLWRLERLGRPGHHDEPGDRAYTVSVPTASFTAVQALARHEQFVIEVHNSGHRALPNVAVSICNTTCAAGAPRGQGTTVEPVLVCD